MCEREVREQTAADTVPVDCDKGSEAKLSGDVTRFVKILDFLQGKYLS
jgi:hypothetical protein